MQNTHTHTRCLSLPRALLAGSLSTRISVVWKHNADTSWQFYTWFQAAAFKWKSRETARSTADVCRLHAAWFHLAVDLPSIGSACMPVLFGFFFFATWCIYIRFNVFACVQLSRHGFFFKQHWLKVEKQTQEDQNKRGGWYCVLNRIYLPHPPNKTLVSISRDIIANCTCIIFIMIMLLK